MVDPVTDELREIAKGDFVIAMCEECIWEIADLPELPRHAYVEPTREILVESNGPWEWLNLAARLMWFGRYRSDPDALKPAADSPLGGSLISQAVAELGAGTPGVEPFDPSRWHLRSNPTKESVRLARSGYFKACGPFARADGGMTPPPLSTSGVTFQSCLSRFRPEASSKSRCFRGAVEVCIHGCGVIRRTCWVSLSVMLAIAQYTFPVRGVSRI